MYAYDNEWQVSNSQQDPPTLNKPKPNVSYSQGGPLLNFMFARAVESEYTFESLTAAYRIPQYRTQNGDGTTSSC